MKHCLPVLVLLAGLGSSISFTQANRQIDPFQRYLAGLKANQPEAAFVRFADECGVDIKAAAPRYAQSPSEKWVPVKDMSKVLKDQETDFYATVAVWHMEDKIMVEQWGMELDTGNYFRRFYCLQRQRISLFEEVDWSIPPLENEKERASYPAWGFEQHRKVGKDGRLEIVLHRFVDVFEQPVKAPKLNADGEELVKDLQSARMVYAWKDLDMPSALLR